MIALISDDTQQERLNALLSEFDKVQLYPSASALAYDMMAGNYCNLLVVAKDGAMGMNECDQVSERKTLGGVLWITEQKVFQNQSKRMGVEGFWAKPVSDDTLQKTVAQLLQDARNQNEHRGGKQK